MSDLNKLQKELDAVRRQETQLAAKLKSAQDARYGALPESVGLSTVDELIKALVPYSSPKMKARFGGAVSAEVKSAPAAEKPAKPAKESKRRRKRAKITDETRAKVKELVQGGKTGAEIAKTLGISLPSVQNIKSAFGLVNKRK